MRRVRSIFLVTNFFIVATIAYGGGLHLHAKVIGFEAKGDDSFTVVLEQINRSLFLPPKQEDL